MFAPFHPINVGINFRNYFSELALVTGYLLVKFQKTLLQDDDQIFDKLIVFQLLLMTKKAVI